MLFVIQPLTQNYGVMMKTLLVSAFLFSVSTFSYGSDWLVLLNKNLSAQGQDQCVETICDIVKDDLNTNSCEIDFQRTIRVAFMPSVSETAIDEVSQLDCVEFLRREGVLVINPRLRRSN